ncbi:MAG: hypothetical protein H6627_03600 [Calditrichae bacterium]|nr:hypothetical protein [Calditrichota bacterium]MCB9057624.1 hypothetical protein [Calditrichia bacterium]
MIAFLFLFNCSEKADDYLAKVNDTFISKNEFVNAYQFNPYLSEIKDDNLAKKYILQSLIFEKVLVSNAPDEIKNDPYLKQKVEQIEREAIIENFWQTQIFPKISIPEEKIYQAYIDSKTKKIVKLYIFDDEKITESAYNQIKSDRAENLSPFSITDTFSTTSTPAGLLSKINDLQIGETSLPFKWGPMYYIAQLENEIKEIGTSEQEYLSRKDKLEKTLFEKAAKEKFDQIINKDNTTVSYEISKYVLKEQIEAVLEKFDSQKLKEKSSIKELNSESKNNKKVISFSDGETWDVTKLWQRIELSPYPLNYKNKNLLRQSLLFAIKNILDDEIIVKKARLAGFSAEYVSEEKRIWHDYYIYNEYLKRILRNKSNAESLILGKIKDANIDIDMSDFNSLKIPRTNMAVLKKQFPGRNISPVIQPLDFKALSVYFEKEIFH